MLTVVAAMLSSCLKSDDDEVVTLYDDAAITSFTLGTLTRYYQPASNPDTTVRTSVTGSYYPMTIDHLNGLIYNLDSLPVGTVARALCTIETKNGGVVGLQGLGSDTVFHVLLSTDTVDLSTDRWFRVVSTDGTTHRDYRMTLNIAKTVGSSFAWQESGSLSLPAPIEDCSVVVTDQPHAVPYKGVVAAGGRAWRLDGGSLLSTTDGQTWTDEGTPSTELSALVGATAHELFALGSDGRLKASRDGGASWTDEQLDDSPSLLPQSSMACAAFDYGPSKNTDYVVLVGNRTDTLATSPLQVATTTMAWRKISYYRQAPAESRWVYMPRDHENAYKLPQLQDGLSLAALPDGKLLLLGSDMVVYQSADQGITWRANSTYALPAGLTGTAARLAADPTGSVLWLLTGSGQLWRGTLR